MLGGDRGEGTRQIGCEMILTVGLDGGVRGVAYRNAPVNST